MTPTVGTLYVEATRALDELDAGPPVPYVQITNLAGAGITRRCNP